MYELRTKVKIPHKRNSRVDEHIIPYEIYSTLNGLTFANEAKPPPTIDFSQTGLGCTFAKSHPLCARPRIIH